MYVATVEELMSGVASVDFVQPWYRCVSTNEKNTGMSLGGIGTAITATPAGTTPLFHFYNGCGIENEEGRTIELHNYYYGESVSDDLTLVVRSPSFFAEDCRAFPLFDTQGNNYFIGDESANKANKILQRIVNAETFVSDNIEKLSEWGFIDQERKGTLYHPRKQSDYRFRNFSFLLNIFAFSIRRNTVYTRSLLADVKETHRLFRECYPAKRMLYEFQYPLSITHYREETQRCSVKKVHITTVCPGNEKLCSLPAYMTAFHISNPTNQAIDVTFVLSVENFIGYDLLKTRTGVQDALLHIQRSFKGQKGEGYSRDIGERNITGLTFRQDASARRGDINGELNFSISTRKSDEFIVTVKSHYYVNTESNVVDAGISTGKVSDLLDDAVSFTQKEPVCGALCISCCVQPGETKIFDVATVIDLPDVQIGNYTAQKKYTQFFPEADYRSRDIAHYIFENRHKIYINEWVWRETFHQKNTLDSGIINASSAGQLRQLMLDNLSFLPESSVWDDKDRFLVRECIDYPFFNSLDVYFYGSFGLLKLLPQMDSKIILEFAQSILSEDLRAKLFGSYIRFKDERIDDSLKGVRKIRDTTPHDMGTPFDADANAYSWKNVALWVDLAPKFVMLVYRNFHNTRDHALLTEAWPAVVAALDYISKNFIGKEGHLPVTTGYANTFDNLRGDGICIYPASLWIAGLTAAEAIADVLGEKIKAQTYRSLAIKGKRQLIASLWDEDAGTYLYSVVNIRECHLLAGLFDEACKAGDERLCVVLEMLNIKTDEVTLGDFLFNVNQFIDDDRSGVAVEHREKLAMYLPPGVALDVSLSSSKVQRRAQKKRLVHNLIPDLFIADFEADVVTPDCEHIFANQLCADTYLYYLDLPEITPLAAQKKILNNIMSRNMGGCNHRIGASNMVARDGKDLDTFQAQEVWVGVQFAIAGALVAAGMIDEFEMLIETLYEAIYKQAKIPFGIPEGFNCVGLFIAEDLIRLDIYSKDQRNEIIAYLKKSEILSSGSTVNFTKIENIKDFVKCWNDEDNEHADKIEADELHELLQATKLKYTAGRYFRAGMVHILPDILRKYRLAHERCDSEEKSLAALGAVIKMNSVERDLEVVSDAQ